MRVTPTRIVSEVLSSLCYKSIGLCSRPPWRLPEAREVLRLYYFSFSIQINLVAAMWPSNSQWEQVIDQVTNSYTARAFIEEPNTLYPILTLSIPTRSGPNFKISGSCIFAFAIWIFIAHSTMVRPKILQLNRIQNKNRLILPNHCTAIVSIPLIQEVLALRLKLEFQYNFWPLVHCLWFRMLGYLYWH